MGFPQSCSALAWAKPPEPDAKALRLRIQELEDVGCHAWILAECTYSGEDVAKQQFNDRQECELTASCNKLGMRLKDAGQVAGARDTYERSCQYDLSDSHRCLGVALEYLDGRWPEPVPGRGQALLDWQCLKWEKMLDKGESILDMLPQCSRMTPHK